MSDHTPGPWHVDQVGGTGIVDSASRPVATAHTYGERSDYEDAANALLAAAAPQMLEALKRLANIASTAASILHENSPEEAALFKADEELARTVIQIATGKR